METPTHMQVLEHGSALHYMGLIDLEQRAEAEARAASVAAHISNSARPCPALKCLGSTQTAMAENGVCRLLGRSSGDARWERRAQWYSPSPCHVWPVIRASALLSSRTNRTCLGAKHGATSACRRSQDAHMQTLGRPAAAGLPALLKQGIALQPEGSCSHRCMPAQTAMAGDGLLR